MRFATRIGGEMRRLEFGFYWNWPDRFSAESRAFLAQTSFALRFSVSAFAPDAEVRDHE